MREKTRDDMKTLYIAYVRSHLEQSAVVWHSSLTNQNIHDLERVAQEMKITDDEDVKELKAQKFNQIEKMEKELD